MLEVLCGQGNCLDMQVWCVCGVLVASLVWCHCGSGNVSKGNCGGHFEGDASGEGTDLFVDVVEESLGFPAAHLLDGHGVKSIEVHGHGSAGAEGVAADIAGCVAEFVESDLASCCFDGFVDLVWSDSAGCCEEWVPVSVNASGGGATVGENVVDPAGQRFDGAVQCVCGLLVDALAFGSVLLIWHADCGFGCGQQRGQWGMAGDEGASGITECDISD